MAHAARRCAPARGLLHSRRSVLRSQRRLLCLMNRTRARFGLRPLRANRCLHRVAARHAHDMVRRRYFALNWIRAVLTWAAFLLFLLATWSYL